MFLKARVRGGLRSYEECQEIMRFVFIRFEANLEVSLFVE